MFIVWDVTILKITATVNFYGVSIAILIVKHIPTYLLLISFHKYLGGSLMCLSNDIFWVPYFFTKVGTKIIVLVASAKL